MGSLGGFYQVVTFTAAKIGQTTIDFLGESQTDPNTGGYIYPPSTGSAAAYQAAPASISVTVSCNFSISLYSVWRLPGQRILDVMGVVQSAKLIPNTIGHFHTVATMSSNAAWMGPCPGASRIQRSPVRISGDVRSQVDIQIDYAPASSTTTEGCIGKSKTDRAQPGTLNVTVPLQGGVLNPQHFLQNILGRTTVVVKRIP